MAYTKDAFTRFYDDSSDEDDTNDGLSRDITGNVNKFTETSTQKPTMTIPFINYSVGLALYNATKVRQIYQSWKNEHLGSCVVPKENDVLRAFNTAIDDAIEFYIKLEQHPKAEEKLTKACLKDLLENEMKNNLLNSLKSHLRLIIKHISAGFSFPENVLEQMTSMDAAIRDFLKKWDYSTLLEKEDFEYPTQITATNLFREMNAHLMECYQAELNEKNFEIQFLDDHGLITQTTRQISTTQKSRNHALHLSTLPDYTQRQKEYFLAMHNVQGRPRLHTFNDQFDEQFLTRRMDELIVEERNRGNLSIIEGRFITENADFATSKFHEYEQYMDAFKPCTGKIFQKLINETTLVKTKSFEQDLLPFIKKAIQKDFEPYVWRKSFPTTHTHNIRSTAEYIVSLRLTRRSLYRTYRNQSQDESILGKSKEEHHDIGWQFPNIGSDYVAIERTQITAKACSSLVKIKTRGDNYLELGKKIQNVLENDPTCTNRQFVLWIRLIITGKALELDDRILPKARHDLTLFLVQLAHLFVGTESIRYPAALVQSQMVMDLIEADLLTWSQAFTESDDHIYYPMILEKATSRCRTLANQFNANSFYSYHYPGGTLKIDDSRIQQYVDAESRLTIEWLKFHKVTENNNNEIPSNIITEAVLNAIPRWYPNIQVHQ